MSALAGRRARMAELRRRGQWPPQVPAVVLTEVLTGDHRRDFHTNQLLRMCQVREVSEQRARDAGRMRTRTGRVATISATDAVVAALAARSAPALVLTSDPDDLRVLVRDSLRPVDVARV